MARSSAAEQFVIKPSNNIYTVLAAVGVIAEIVAFIVLWLTHETLFGTGLFS